MFSGITVCQFTTYVVILSVVFAQCVTCHHLTTSKQKERELEISQEISRERLMADKMLHLLMDVADEYFRGIGASDGEMKELGRKRAIITRCYFQAIACY